MATTTKKKSDKPLILITNDDGITSTGIRALVEAMRVLGKVVVSQVRPPLLFPIHA